MPVVFSPGEPETRPLEPDAIVYTTAQKVADLLGIGPSEAVLASANTEADRVYVTGSDYRSHGFAVDDTILIYSDAQALGVEKKITAVTEGGSNGVALYFTGDNISNISDYQTADNTYIQNQASFTNGKTSGMKRSVVETRIKEVQDRIDNITHNAWRPYLVSAEYINFDTYKPYRRRYFTDYVGTTPLLFRNVQQILRLELWQGDDYREICGAEVRITLPDDVRALNDKRIVLSPGNGSAAQLQAIRDANSTGAWEVTFDKITAAQNLADLINKEDRVSKAALNFSPAFYLEDSGGTSKVSVHNEFLASANSDYGSGQVKVSSMKPTKAGEVCSIVSNSSDITFSKVNTHTATVASGGGSTVTVDSTTGFAKAGVFTDGTNVIRYTGVNATQFTGCATVIGSLPSSGTITQNLFGLSLQGGTGDQARLKDWWLDAEMGIIYFNNSYPFFEHNAVKVSYIYGERYLEKAIEEAATKMVAADLLMSDDRSVLIPEGSQNVDLGAKIQLFRKEAEQLLVRYKEVVVFS